MGVRGLRKKRIAGLGLLGVLLGLFIGFNRFPKLDIVRDDLAAVSGPSAQCFQGFCINTGQSLLARWWEFSITYMELVAPGMIFAFLVAGLTAAFLFPQGVQFSSSGGIWGAIKGIAVGTPLSLCSACIVPITRALRGSGASISTTLGVVQGSATLNVPALLMVALIFTPLLGGSRILLSLIAGLLIGPVVARIVGGEKDEVPPSGVPLALGDAEPVGWGEALWEATRDWVRASLVYLIRLGPIMVIAGFASGLALQWVRPDVVGDYLGNDVQGVALAATLGILINVPLLFEIPLVVVLLLLGMGEAPAATLLFTAAAGGPITFWGLARALPRRAIVAFAGATWVVGLVGGIAIFALTPFVPDTALGFRSIADTRHDGGEGLGVVNLPAVEHQVQLASFTVQQPPAGEGEVTLAFNRLEAMQNGFHYEAWAVYDANVLSLGKFNVGPAGELVDLQGLAIAGGRFALGADAAGVTDLLVTIEPPDDADGVPSDTRFLAGVIEDGVAEISVDHPLALDNSYRRARAFYILSSPSSRGEEDWKSGVWWIDLTYFDTLAGDPGFHLPLLPPGWVYEGWVEIQGRPFTTGRFYYVDGHDFDSPHNGPLPFIPAMPGEDYIINPPKGYDFPTDIRGEPIFVTIEPYPDDSRDPFTLMPLWDTIPPEGGYRVTYKVENVARDRFPVGQATVR